MLAVKKNPKNAQVYRNYLMVSYSSYALSRERMAGLTTTQSFACGIFPGWVSIFCIKISVLTFYRRLFFITKWYQHASLALMIFTGAWLISTIVAFGLSAQPFDAYWNIFKPAKRFNFPLFYLLIGVIDTIIDVLIVALPVRVAFHLHLPLRAKIGVAGIFGLGAFVVGTNITRLILVYGTGPWTGQSKFPYHSQMLDLTSPVNLLEDERWQNVHTMVGIVCACLPVYKPLWNSISTSAGDFFGHYTVSLRSILGSKSVNNGRDGSKENYPGISQVRLGAIDSPHTSNSKIHDVEHGYLPRKEQLLF